MDADHSVRIIAELVDKLPLEPLIKQYRHARRSPYEPRTMLKVILYEMHRGSISPAQWLRDSRESLPVLWLLGGLRPGRSTWYEFQQRLDPVIDEIHTELLKHAPGEKQTAAIDGTFIAANTSRHRLLSKPRLLERMELLRQNLDGVTTQTPRWLARCERGKRLQLRTYHQAVNRLERRLEKNAKLSPRRRKPENKVLTSPTDSEAALGLDKLKTYRPLYNVQAVHDTNTDWILGHDVLPTNTDVGTLAGTLDRCRNQCGCVPQKILTDGRYATEQDLLVCEAAGVTLYAPYGENTLVKSPEEKSKKRFFKKEAFAWDAEREAYRCPNGETLTRQSREYRHVSDGVRLRVFRFRCPPESCLACPQNANCTPAPAKGRSLRRSQREDLVDALRQRMTLPESLTLYRQRSSSIERCFGDMKTHRDLTRFSRRGLHAAQTTVGLWVLLHNGLLWLRGQAQAENTPEIDTHPPDF